jgi:hypothetical protein
MFTLAGGSEIKHQTSNEPVLRVSNDNGKTFGEKDNLSAK